MYGDYLLILNCQNMHYQHNFWHKKTRSMKKFWSNIFLCQIKLINNHSDLKKIELLKTKTWWSKDLKQDTVKHQNQPNIHLEIKGLFYVVKPHPHGVGDLKSQNPGAPWGGEFKISKPRGPHGVGDLKFHGGSQTLVFTSF